MTTDLPAPTADPPSAPPGSYWAWLTGVSVTRLTTAVVAFGLTWAATADGPLWASAVLMAVLLPRAVLMLVGGAVADRRGPAQVMISSDATMVAVMLTSAAAALWGGTPPLLLVVVSLAMGVADAFYLPSSSAVPKLLVPESALGRAMAANQLVSQVSSVVGPALGGVVMAAAGVPLALVAGATGFAVMLVVMLRIRRAFGDVPPVSSGSSVLTDARSSWRFLVASPVLRAVALVTAAAATFVIPVAPFLVPLVARDRGWEASGAGVVTGCYAAGIGLVTLAVVVRGQAARPGLVGAVGILVAGIGTGLLALSPGMIAASLATTLAGAGTGLFSTHVGPLFASTAPREQISRLSALMILAQSLPLLVTNPLIGVVAVVSGADTATMLWAAGAVGAGCFALAARPLRAARARPPSA